jgi:hypothetical protein
MSLLVAAAVRRLQQHYGERVREEIGHAVASPEEVEVPEGMKATAILPSGALKALLGGRQSIREPLPGAAN